ncbi:PDZ domain-containing protein [Bacillus sp. FSL K6-6540]|uniref:PDZ domain-containing protein n=1 Tax=Bacillus sp. FSL K6-6540 TaxID=2921512 RepID=UPI0030F63166
MKLSDRWLCFVLYSSVLFTLLAVFCIWPFHDRSWVKTGNILLADDYIDVSTLTDHPYPKKTNFYLTYVSSQTSNRYLSDLRYWLNGYHLENMKVLSDHNSGTALTLDDQYYVGLINAEEAVHNAIVVALSYLDIPFDEQIKQPMVEYIPENYETGKAFHIKDEIVRIDDSNIDPFNSVTDVLRQKKRGDRIHVTVKREGQLVTLPIVLNETDTNGELTLGVLIRVQFVFDQIQDHEVVKFPPNFSGSSSGLMLALGLIQKLDLSHDYSGGLKIAGTGGISRGGDVKAIANLSTKIETAQRKGADVFLFPASQEDEAYEAAQKLGISRMKLVPVNSVSQAIDRINQIKTEGGLANESN